MREWLRLKKLERDIWKAERKYKAFTSSEKYKKLNAEDKRAEHDIYIQTEYLPLEYQIEEIKTKRFLRKVQKYGIPYPQHYEEEGEGYWQETEYGYHCLSEKGYHVLKKAIREEQKEIRDAILCWAPLITALTGLVGAIVAVLTIIRYWGK